MESQSAEMFAPETGIFNAIPPDHPEPPGDHSREPDPPSSVEAVAAEMEAATLQYKETWSRRDHHEEEHLRYEEVIIDEEKLVKAARLRLIETIIRADGGPLPESIQWYDSTSPIWSVISGGKFYGLFANEARNFPITFEKAAQAVSLVILDAPLAPVTEPTTPRVEAVVEQPEPRTRAQACREIVDEAEWLRREALDFFVSARSAYGLIYKDVDDFDISLEPGDPRSMEQTFQTALRLEVLATEAAAVAIVTSDPTVETPHPEAQPEDWPTRCVIRDGTVFIGGKLTNEQRDPFVGVAYCEPRHVINLDRKKGVVL
jgi:hypothetical protein